jgi:hypothetical protein
MTHLVGFRTAKFDIAAETPNPINPIAGRSVLDWLRTALAKHGYVVAEPDAEDWGWYMDVKSNDAAYMVGASADAEDPSPVTDWLVQVHKHRSFKEKLLGRNKLAADDSLTTLIESIVRADTQMTDISVDRSASR